MNQWSNWFEWSRDQFGSLIELLRQTNQYRVGFYNWLHVYLRPPASILEAGCGIGITGMTLQGMGYKVTGIDYDDYAVENSKRLAMVLCPQFTVQKMDIFDLPESPKYDLVLNMGVLEHFQHDAALAMIRKVAAASNKYVLVQVGTNTDNEEGRSLAPVAIVHTISSLKAILEEAGLTIVDWYKWGQSLAVLASVLPDNELRRRMIARYVRFFKWRITW